MNHNDKKAVIYCRVSTRDQVEEGNSLSTQEKNCREYAIKYGYQIAQVFIEQGESAKTAQRTELQKLLVYCSNKKNNISAVIAYKLDRISRNTDDYSQLRILLKRYGVEIKSTSEYFENTPAGRFMENIIANVAQFDNDVRAERSIGGMKEAMREGRYVWRAPAGYKNDKVAGKSTIVPNEHAALIKYAFEKVGTEIGSIEKTRILVNKAGLITNKGNPISKSQFYDLLRNKIYAGWIVKFGEQHRGLFEPLVSQEMFDQVQRILRLRKGQKSSYKTKHPDFPLRNFPYHPNGSLLTGCWAKGRKKKYAYYMYRLKQSNYRKEWLETKFKEALDQFAFNVAQFNKFKRYVHEHLVQEKGNQKKNTDIILQYISDLKSKQRQLIDKNLEGIISNDILQRELKEIDEELVRKSATVLKTHEFKHDLKKLLELSIAYLKTPSKIWEKSTAEQKIELQWFYFPEGICFDGKNCRTTEICNIFNIKSDFYNSVSGKVPLMISKSNTPKLGNAQIAYRRNRKKYKNLYPVEEEEKSLSLQSNKIINDLIHIDKIRRGDPVKQEGDTKGFF